MTIQPFHVDCVKLNVIILVVYQTKGTKTFKEWKCQIGGHLVVVLATPFIHPLARRLLTMTGTQAMVMVALTGRSIL